MIPEIKVEDRTLILAVEPAAAPKINWDSQCQNQKTTLFKEKPADVTSIT